MVFQNHRATNLQVAAIFVWYVVMVVAVYVVVVGACADAGCMQIARHHSDTLAYHQWLHWKAN